MWGMALLLRAFILHPWPRHFNRFPPLFDFIYSTVKLSVETWEWCIWNPPVIYSLRFIFHLQAPSWIHLRWLNGILVSCNFNYTVHRKESNKKCKNKNTVGPTFLVHSTSTVFVCSSNINPSIRWVGVAHCVVWCCWLHSQCSHTSPRTAAHSGPGSTLSQTSCSRGNTKHGRTELTPISSSRTWVVQKHRLAI